MTDGEDPDDLGDDATSTDGVDECDLQEADGDLDFEQTDDDQREGE